MKTDAMDSGGAQEAEATVADPDERISRRQGWASKVTKGFALFCVLAFSKVTMRCKENLSKLLIQVRRFYVVGRFVSPIGDLCEDDFPG